MRLPAYNPPGKGTRMLTAMTVVVVVKEARMIREMVVAKIMGVVVAVVAGGVWPMTLALMVEVTRMLVVR